MQPDTSPVGTAPGAQESLSISWQKPTAMVALSFVNAFLKIVTLGVYHFWAKTEVRKRIWSAIRINGEPMSYTGRGMELFLGFVIVILLIFLPMSLAIAGLVLAFGPTHIVPNIVITAAYVALAVLFPIAIYRAIRYRLARTSWRGIRGALEGKPLFYAWTFIWTLLLIPLTLGWIIPWRTTKLQSIISNNMHFGNRRLRFDATSGALYGPFAALYLGTGLIYLVGFSFIGPYLLERIMIAQQTGVQWQPNATDIASFLLILLFAGLLLALMSAWYQARTINHFANHTQFENARFSGNATAGGLIWLTISNWFILLIGAVLFAGVAAGISAPFIDLADVRAPETAITMQIVFFAFIIGFTLFTPIVQARTAGYIVRHLSISGTAPLSEIEQSAGANVRYAEGLAEAFDVDAF